MRRVSAPAIVDPLPYPGIAHILEERARTQPDLVRSSPRGGSGTSPLASSAPRWWLSPAGWPRRASAPGTAWDC